MSRRPGDGGCRPAKFLSMEFTNWREREQAANLCLLRRLPRPSRCFWAVTATPASQSPARLPMGWHFRAMSGTDPFVIDQTVTVSFQASPAVVQALLAEVGETLAAHAAPPGSSGTRLPPRWTAAAAWMPSWSPPRTRSPKTTGRPCRRPLPSSRAGLWPLTQVPVTSMMSSVRPAKLDACPYGDGNAIRPPRLLLQGRCLAVAGLVAEGAQHLVPALVEQAAQRGRRLGDDAR